MAITVAATSSGNSGGATTTHTITLPSGTQAGDLVLVFFCNDASEAPTPPPAWSTVFTEQNSGKCTLSVFYRILTAPLLGPVTITTASSLGSAYACYRVTGSDQAVAPQVATATSGNDPNPDPPLLNPAAWDTGSALWIAVAGWDRPRACTAFPLLGDQVSNYWNNNSGCGVAACTEVMSSSQYDPFPYTIDRREGWVANTIAIRQVQPQATISQTLPSLVQSATAGVLAEASVVQVLPAIGQSATAAQLIGATIDQPLPAISQSASANATVNAAVIQQAMPAIAQSAVATSIVGAAITQDLPALQQAGTAAVDLSVSILQQLPSLEQSAVADSGTTVDIVQAMPAITQSGTAEVDLSAWSVQVLPAMTQDADCTIDVSAAVGPQSLPAIAQEATVDLDDGGRTATISQSLPAMSQVATVGSMVSVSIDQTLAAIGQSVDVSMGTTVSLRQRLPAMQQDATAQTGLLAETRNILPSIVQSGSIENDTPIPEPRKKSLGIVSADDDVFAVFSGKGKKLVVSSAPRRQRVSSR